MHFVSVPFSFLCHFFPKLSQSSPLMTKTNVSSFNLHLHEVLIYNHEGKRLYSIYEWVPSHRVDAAAVLPRVTHITTDNRCLFLFLPSSLLHFTFKNDDMRPRDLFTSQTKDFTCRICFHCYTGDTSKAVIVCIIADDYSHFIKSGACFTTMKAGRRIPRLLLDSDKNEMLVSSTQTPLWWSNSEVFDRDSGCCIRSSALFLSLADVKMNSLLCFIWMWFIVAIFFFYRPGYTTAAAANNLTNTSKFWPL